MRWAGLICGIWFKIVNDCIGVRKGGNGHLSPLDIGIKNQILLEKTEVGIFIPIFLIWFLQWQFFACMKLTLHKSQVHSYSVMQWWVCSSLMSLLCLQRWVTKIVSGLFYCWSSLRDNNLATHQQRFTLYSGSRCFVVWDCWTHASWQVIQRDSDMLIAVSHVHLYFVKRSMSESTAMQPQVWKIHY